MRTYRAALLAGSALLGVLALALPASAHVTISPASAPKGGDAVLSFHVPNEQDNASTTKVLIAFPQNPPIPSVAVRPQPGWTTTTTTTKPATPIKTDDGEVTTVVSQITWTATGSGIRPGQYNDFDALVGSLPQGADSLTFKVLQTYSNGAVVRWIDQTQPGQPEPDHPAPVLKLTAAAGGEGAGSTASTTQSAAGAATLQGSTSDSTTRGLAIAGLVAGVVGLAAGGTALAAARSRRSS